jgi:hypothetical protein
MFLDDDVVLEPGCVHRLVDGLLRFPEYGALAADYRHESGESDHFDEVCPSRHVAMGATVFRREVLAFVPFRSTDEKCECQCCCDDLRAAGFGIGYLMGAVARHENPRGVKTSRVKERETHPSPSQSPRVLTAFNRRHLARFRRRFLPTLRAWGNSETVTAVTYGLFPSEREALAALPGVETINCRDDEDSVIPARRLRDFQTAISHLPAETPVAYWDAGDVFFQARIAPLWDLVRANPDRLLATADGADHPENKAVAHWTLTIADPDARRYAYDLLTTNVYLNGGFAAGTVSTMLRYLRAAHRIRHSKAMHGSVNRGDQTVLNLYCHSDPSRWREVPSGWNFCTFHRGPAEFQVLPNGRFRATDGSPIHVVHGNGRDLRNMELSYLEA